MLYTCYTIIKPATTVYIRKTRNRALKRTEVSGQSCDKNVRHIYKTHSFFN